jgi:hypothetical protein
LDYFLLKYIKLKELSVLSPHMQLNYHYSERLDPRTNKIYKKLSVTTLAPFLHLRHYFYPDNIKIIPSNIAEVFTNESLAY